MHVPLGLWSGCYVRRVFSPCYLHDFVGAEPSYEKACNAYARFNELAATLGLKMASDKCSPPEQSLVWLGISINTQAMTVSLPPEKLPEIVLECDSWSRKLATTQKQLQSLAGKCVNSASR